MAAPQWWFLRHSISFSASALTTQYCTAYYCAAVAANLREGECVIIHSAAGGSRKRPPANTRCIKHCEIIATTGSASKVELLRRLGAYHVIDTSKENFFAAVKAIKHAQGIDVIFDALGESL